MNLLQYEERPAADSLSETLFSTNKEMLVETDNPQLTANIFEWLLDGTNCRICVRIVCFILFC